MKNVIFIALLALISFSCKTVKSSVKTDTKNKTEDILNIDQSSTSNKNSDTNIKSTDKSVLDDVLNETVTNTKFSVPDQSGKQYTTEKTVTNRTKSTKQLSNINTEVKAKSDTQEKIKNTDKSLHKSDSKSEATSDIKTKISTPGFLTTGVLILIAALIVIAIQILKKYKLL